ncbi:MAG: hypothetical protein QM760_14565 [Nibricoccus sp.]
MNNTPPKNPPPSPPASSVGASAAGDSPGVPGFRTWRGVYLFVFACFVAVVVALTIFSRVYA